MKNSFHMLLSSLIFQIIFSYFQSIKWNLHKINPALNNCHPVTLLIQNYQQIPSTHFDH